MYQNPIAFYVTSNSLSIANVVEGAVKPEEKPVVYLNEDQKVCIVEPRNVLTPLPVVRQII